MHLFVPYNGGRRARAALVHACRIAQPGDTITLMAAIVVPGYYAVDVMPAVIWKQTCDAERRLKRAGAIAAPLLRAGVELRSVGVQARNDAAAIIAGARHYGADLILFARRFVLPFGTVATVGRHAPCGVRVLAPTPRSPCPTERWRRRRITSAYPASRRWREINRKMSTESREATHRERRATS